MRNEKEFQGEMPLSFRMYFARVGLDYFYHKIRDDGGLQMYDAHCWYAGGGYIGLEYKMNKSKRTINMDKLFDKRQHQIRNLQQRIDLGSKAEVIINWYIPRVLNRAFSIAPSVAGDYIAKGTVPMEDFIADPRVTELKRESHLGRPYWVF